MEPLNVQLQSRSKVRTQSPTFRNKMPSTGEKVKVFISPEHPSQTNEDQVCMLRRHVGKVMIVVAGQSGAGKSSIIESFFTKLKIIKKLEVVEFGKDLRVTSQSPPITGVLSFVELSNNLAAATEFRTERFDHKQQYPNMVIFTVFAYDNRMIGTDSNLRKSLMLLKDSGLTDNQIPNVIVAATHAMSLPLKLYTRRTEDITDNIRKVVYDVLGISDVKVVFVENQPVDYGMEKHEQLDFYILPDRQISHFNLMQAMSEQLKTNKDLLGRLFCDWYFKDEDCVERDHEASLLYKIEFSKEKEGKKELYFDIAPEYSFHYIGRGYCPITENLKNVSIFPLTETAVVDLFGKKYAKPSCVNIYPSENKKCSVLTTVSKENYEKQKLVTYGLEGENYKLSVTVNNSGKWVNDEIIQKKKAEVVFVYEKSLAEVTLDLQKLRLCAKQKLLNDIKGLPRSYEHANSYLFIEFFSKWGTHFVSEEWLGGYIEVELRVDSHTYTEHMGDQIYNLMQSYFVDGNREAITSNSLLSDGEDIVKFFGGKLSTLPMIMLHSMSYHHLSEWEQSLATNPTELKHCFKLQPYYNIADEPNYKSLKEATQHYLSGDMFSKNNSRKRGYDCEEDDYSDRNPKDPKIEKECFPMMAKIYTKEGPVECGRLVPGCQIQTLTCTSASDKNLVEYTEFCTYLHYDPDVETEFLVLNLANHQALTVSKNHLLFAFRSGYIKSVMAENVKVEDEVLFVTQDTKIQLVKVSSISKKKYTGICCPLTHDGTLIVDGVLVSCYASIESFVIAHTSLMPLRMWYKFKKVLFCLTRTLVGKVIPRLNYSSAASKPCYRPNTGIHVYARMLVFLCRLCVKCDKILFKTHDQMLVGKWKYVTHQ